MLKVTVTIVIVIASGCGLVDLVASLQSDLLFWKFFNFFLIMI